MSRNYFRTNAFMRRPPEISIEWTDVTIEIKVCSPELQPVERSFVKYYPELDTSLLCFDDLDAKKSRERKKAERQRTNPQYEYVPLDEAGPEEDTARVLPKLTCSHCGKTFSRQSTLDQHMVTHSSSQSWEEVQDAAIQDLEHAITYGSDPSLVALSQQARLLQTKTPGVSGDEEEEISPPEDLNTDKKEEEEEEEYEEDNSSNYEPNEISLLKSGVPRNEIKQNSHDCSRCTKTFSKVSLLNRHMKLHLGIKPYQCTICGWRFLQSYNLKKHLLTHSKKDLRCSQCKASFKDQNTLKEHVKRRHSHQGTVTQIQSTPKVNSKGQKMYPCPHCEKAYTSQEILDKHIPFHRKCEKKYFCSICGMRFHLIQNMQRHLRTHGKSKKEKAS